MSSGIDPILSTASASFPVTLAAGLWSGRDAGEGYAEYALAGRDPSHSAYRCATLYCPGLTVSGTKSRGRDSEAV